MYGGGLLNIDLKVEKKKEHRKIGALYLLGIVLLCLRP